MTVKKGTALSSLYLDCFFICKVQDMEKLNRPEDPFCLRKKALLWEKDAWKPSPCLKEETLTLWNSEGRLPLVFSRSQACYTSFCCGVSSSFEQFSMEP